MAAIDPSNYILKPFDLNFALSGGVLFAEEKIGSGSGDVLYYVAAEFQRSPDGNRRYPYQALIEDVTYLFDISGVTSQGRFTLKCVEEYREGSEGGGESASGGGSISKFNAAEIAALETLKAMITLQPNPLGYKNSTMKLLTQKAFSFSKEFMAQARDGRGSGGGDDYDGTITVESLNGLANVKKFVFCTQYPAVGEEGVVYIKLRTASGSGELNSIGGQA